MTAPGQQGPRWGRRLSAALGLVASLIAVVGFVFGVTRLHGEERPLLPQDDITTSSPPEPEATVPTISPKQAYIQAADEACWKWLEESGRAEQQFPSGSIEAVDAQVRITYSMISDWRAVVPPESDRVLVDGIIDMYLEIAELQEDHARYLRGRDAASAQQALADADDKYVAAREHGRAYGFRVCTG